MSVAMISHPSCLKHEMGDTHPEQPARVTAISEHLAACGLDKRLKHQDAKIAHKEQLLLAHAAEYVEQIFSVFPSDGYTWLDPDTAMNPHTLDAALHAAGSVVQGVDLVMLNEVQRVFCNVRPPGHHATRTHAMGFCIFNNVAIGACHALAQHSLQRVAIVDFDVHHGNGTEDIVSGDERILFCSTFQHPFYPHCGFDSGASNVVNVPLASGTAGEGFREAVDTHWLPRLHEFSPQLILVSAGFDAHRADDMAGLNLIEEDFHWVTRKICDIADQYCNGRLVSSLEGGYQLDALAHSVEAHIRAFFGE